MPCDAGRGEEPKEAEAGARAAGQGPGGGAGRHGWSGKQHTKVCHRFVT